MDAKKLAWGGVALAGTAAGAAGYMAFRSDMAKARARIASGGEVAETSFGLLEYGCAGAGRPVLVVHGAGGGFDQGLAFAGPLLAAGRRVIAPSRFGYLGSAFPDDASAAGQVDAFAQLLDRLGIDRLPVCGGSAGANSAIQFAIRHADRCSALILAVPAVYTPGHEPPERQAALRWVIDNILLSDFWLWTIMRAAPDLLIGTLLATDPQLVHRATPGEQARVRAILQGLLPVSARRRGLLYDSDGARHVVPLDLAAIRAPTLILSADDDRYGTASAARMLASGIDGAKLVVYPQGGHVWVGLQDRAWRKVNAFLADHAA